jgi:hypothetical protein
MFLRDDPNNLKAIGMKMRQKAFLLAAFFISISILSGKRKPGGIGRETGKGAAENRPGRDWTGREAARR